MPVVVRIGNGEVDVDVSPMGAEMQAITTRDGRNWLWTGDAAFWGGRSPILFPMVGKAPDDHVTIEGQRYAMGQHGFARRSEFSVAEVAQDFCRMELVASEASKAMYPFDFKLMVEHRVEGRAVLVTAEVTNLDHRMMPFGLGFHPAFMHPLPGGEGHPHEVWLDNGAEPALVRLNKGLVKPEELPSPFHHGVWPVDHDMFRDDAMVFPEGAGAGLRYGSEGGPELLFTWENLPNFALWSKPGAGFLCLEPWHGTAAEAEGSDDLMERPYVEVLGPGATARFGFKVEMVG